VNTTNFCRFRTTSLTPRLVIHSDLVPDGLGRALQTSVFRTRTSALAAHSSGPPTWVSANLLRSLLSLRHGRGAANSFRQLRSLRRSISLQKLGRARLWGATRLACGGVRKRPSVSQRVRSPRRHRQRANRGPPIGAIQGADNHKTRERITAPTKRAPPTDAPLSAPRGVVLSFTTLDAGGPRARQPGPPVRQPPPTAKRFARADGKTRVPSAAAPCRDGKNLPRRFALFRKPRNQPRPPRQPVHDSANPHAYTSTLERRSRGGPRETTAARTTTRASPSPRRPAAEDLDAEGKTTPPWLRQQQAQAQPTLQRHVRELAGQTASLE